jgi:hypothetical protein
MYIHTQGQSSRTSTTTPPPYDPPAAPFRRGTYCFAYALSLAISLFSTSFEISVICIVAPYSSEMLSDRCKSHDLEIRSLLSHVVTKQKNSAAPPGLRRRLHGDCLTVPLIKWWTTHPESLFHTPIPTSNRISMILISRHRRSEHHR